MKILVVGGGGREHALCWKLKQDDPRVELHAAPGNPGIAALATCHPIAATDATQLLALATRHAFGLVIVGPEAPLAAGLADLLSREGIPVFGPSAAAARIESSKSFAKNLMLRNGVPTALATSHSDAVQAKRAVRDLGVPVVIKASGLAAGKGVIVAATLADADAAIDSFLSGSLGASGSLLLVEEFMDGEEISLFAVSDGRDFVLLAPSQDHKRLLDGDRGPNTGGMGAYAPVSVATSDLLALTSATIIRPVLEALQREGTPFKGLLYAGLMLTGSGPKVVEFNCRFGDPETQVVLPLMNSALLPLLVAATRDGELGDLDAPRFSSEYAVTTVMAAQGYPASPKLGDPIEIPRTLPAGATVFHAGTKLDGSGRLVTAGGRVLSVTGVAETLENAVARSQAALGSIHFEGAQWRRDIGWRERERSSGR